MSFTANQFGMFYERGVIMNTIAEYLLTVTAAAIVCSIAKTIAGEKGTAGKIAGIVSGIFLIVTLIAPITRLEFDHAADYFNSYRLDATEISIERS